MGAGAQIARAEADAVLVSNRLDDVVRARALARKAQRVVRQNLVWAAVYNAACVPLALLGALLDPSMLSALDAAGPLSPGAIHSLAFLVFWAVIAAASALTQWLQGDTPATPWVGP